MRATAVSFSAFCASLAFYHDLSTRTSGLCRLDVEPPVAYLSTQEARLRDGRHARVVSGPLINLEETSTLLLPSLPPSLVRKSHRRARFGVLPKRVARRHGKFAASRLWVQGPGAVGGGNGPVAGRASPPGPSPLHPLPRPSSLL